MKKIVLATLLLFSFGCGMGKKKHTHVINDQKHPRYLYVLSAKEGSFSDDELKLKSIPSVVYFSDRPSRVAGHITLEKFGKLWNKQAFDADPPNGNLSVLELKGSEGIELELEKASVDGDEIVFKAKLIKGKLPEKFEENALFIDTEKEN